MQYSRGPPEQRSTWQRIRVKAERGTITEVGGSIAEPEAIATECQAQLERILRSSICFSWIPDVTLLTKIDAFIPSLALRVLRDPRLAG